MTFIKQEDADKAVALLHQTQIGGYRRIVRVEKYEVVHEERHISKRWTDRDLVDQAWLSQTQAQKSEQMQLRMKIVTNRHTKKEIERAAFRQLNNSSTQLTTNIGDPSGKNNSKQLTSGLSYEFGNICQDVSMSGNYSNQKALSQSRASHSRRSFSNSSQSSDINVKVTSHQGSEQSGSSKYGRKVTPANGE